MTTLYLIRHAEAEGNIFRRAQGSHNGRPTAKGRRQIAALTERFRSVPVDAVYASDRIRAQETARGIAETHGLSVQTDERLRELHLGVWEDVPFGDLQYNDPAAMELFNNDPDEWLVPDCERHCDLRARICAALTELCAAHEGQSIVCVSHGMAIRAFLANHFGIPSSEMRGIPHGDNTCVACFEFEAGSFRIRYYNDAGHLPPELSTFARQSWWKSEDNRDFNNVRFKPLDVVAYPALYRQMFPEAWAAAHGAGAVYDFNACLAAAQRRCRSDENALVAIVPPDAPIVGVLELDPDRGEAESWGWLDLIYVDPAHRRQQLGVQLLGHAVTYFREQMRRALRTEIPAENQDALHFFEEYDFRLIGERAAAEGRMLLLEKPLFP